MFSVSTRRGVAVSLLLVLSAQARAAPVAEMPDPLSPAELHRISDIFAGSVVETGKAIGIGVAVVRAGRPARLFTYGFADWAAQRPFTEHSRFEIGSVTKVFTTNLLGQAVNARLMSLSTPLSAFGPELGSLPASTADVTLGELGSFTAGYPTLAPLCGNQNVPGCLPSERPTVAQYGAADFAAYFRGTPAPASLPAGYTYSDFSTGLIGLLLGAPQGRPLGKKALPGWQRLLEERLLWPLRMRDTAMLVPAGDSDLASGYQLPVLSVSIRNGGIASVANASVAGPYQTSPTVTVVGGGGHGASVAATLDKQGFLVSLPVLSGGTGYVPPPSVVFDAPSGQTGRTAKGEAIIRGGRVIGIRILDTGSGYGAGQVVKIHVTGGRSAFGRDAIARGRVVASGVAFGSVTYGGVGYVRPLAVLVTPGQALHNTVPIWAPAGALKSSLSDMARLVRAALPASRSGSLGFDGSVEPVRAGFRIAEQPAACQVAIYMPLAKCPSGSPVSGLAWSITRPDPASHFPATVIKTGGLTGFSTQVLLMPSRGLGVVVMVNSRQAALNDGADQGVSDNTLGITAPMLAHEIADAIFFAGPPGVVP